MELENDINENCSLLMHMLSTTTTLPIITATLQYLDSQELQILAQIGLYRFEESKFFNIAVSKVFINKYLNRVDRSVFFMFYEDEEFRTIQQSTTNMLACQHSQFLAETFKNIRNILRFLQITTQFLNSQPQFQSLIQQFFFEPELPMPKLKRETIGMYCQTALQEHLSLLKFSDDDIEQMWMQQPLEELKTKIEEQIQEKKYQIPDGKEEINNLIRDVRFFGYKINHLNWRSYLIAKFNTHNLIVFLLALCSQMVFTFQQLVLNIEDPFMKFTEFALRSNIYRNIVLSIEEKFNFVFKNYSQFYAKRFSVSQEVPAINFWRPAMSIWIQGMKYFHDQNKVVYNYITSKLRERNMNEFLKIKTQKLPSFFSELKREMQFQIFSQERKNKVYLKMKNKVVLQSFFENNVDIYETLAKDYVEYMVDISINEFNVHWCGHSEHIIKKYPLFRDYYDNAVKESLEFYMHIRETISHSVPKEIQLNIFKEVVKQDLLFSQTRLYRPVIVRQIVQNINKWIKKQLHNMPDFTVFDQQGFSKHKIVIDFQQKDGLLKYFAAKNEIPEDCPNQLEFYYNIQLQPKDVKYLKEVDEQNIQEMEQYFSDEEEEMQQEY